MTFTHKSRAASPTALCPALQVFGKALVDRDTASWCLQAAGTSPTAMADALQAVGLLSGLLCKLPEGAVPHCLDAWLHPVAVQCSEAAWQLLCKHLLALPSGQASAAQQAQQRSVSARLAYHMAGRLVCMRKPGPDGQLDALRLLVDPSVARRAQALLQQLKPLLLQEMLPSPVAPTATGGGSSGEAGGTAADTVRSSDAAASSTAAADAAASRQQQEQAEEGLHLGSAAAVLLLMMLEPHLQLSAALHAFGDSDMAEGLLQGLARLGRQKQVWHSWLAN